MVLLMITPVAVLAILYQTVACFHMFDKRPVAGVPLTPVHATSPGHSVVSLAVLALATLNLPALGLRLVFAQQATTLQALLILKNLLCCVNSLSIMVTKTTDNSVSNFITRITGVATQEGALGQADAGDFYSHSREDIQDKLMDLAKLIDEQAAATKTLSFQRSVLAAQKGVFIGIMELDAHALREGFQAFDSNHDGKLSSHELEVMMKSVAGVIEPQEIARFIQDCDKNGDGMVDYKEFASRIISDTRIRSTILKLGPRASRLV